jgi:polyphosphate kinase
MLDVKHVETDDLQQLIVLINKMRAKFDDDSNLSWAQVHDMENAGLLTKGTYDHFVQTTESLIIQCNGIQAVVKSIVER